MQTTPSREHGIQVAKILTALVELNKVSKILDSFLPVFTDKTIPKGDKVYLHGNFNLGGTVSGRLSSNSPNMQNLPSTGTVYAKAIKQCFSSPDDWLIVGADFLSLEDRISALITKDSNKLKVYTDGYDGHCLRAYYYFKGQMSDITEELSYTANDTFYEVSSSSKTTFVKGSRWPVEGPRIVDPASGVPMTQVTQITSAKYSVGVINSIATRYKKIRQDSKAPTFLLTYGGTFHGLMKNCGFDEATAKSIEKNYHDLYKESDKWIQNKLTKATKTGYVECAFGLKVRTPKLAQTIPGRKVSYEAQAEARTAGNALGQSWGLLNNRAQNEFLEKVRVSEFLLDIHPIAAIHDSQYYLVRRRPEVVKFVNDNLIACMEWNKHPTIYHPEVGLGAELEIFYPTWAESTKIHNGSSLADITNVLNQLL